MECYLELSCFEEPVLETKKVRDLLARIKAPELAAAKQQVKATANLSNNFEEAVNFLSLSILPLKSSSHKVAAIGSGGGSNNSNQNGRGPGRGRGGRNQNRGGRSGRFNKKEVMVEDMVEVVIYGPLITRQTNGTIYLKNSETECKRLDPLFPVRVVKKHGDK